jgi:hypothetical protein
LVVEFLRKLPNPPPLGSESTRQFAGIDEHLRATMLREWIDISTADLPLEFRGSWLHVQQGRLHGGVALSLVTVDPDEDGGVSRGSRKDHQCCDRLSC